MSTTRITNCLPSKNMIETTLLTAAFVTIHVAAYLDRAQDIESNNAGISLSLASKILASLHSASALFKIWENFERAGHHAHVGKYMVASGLSLVTAFGALGGVWGVADSEANLALGVTNATGNFLGRLFSSANRNAVMSELEVRFDHASMSQGNARELLVKDTHHNQDYQQFSSP